MVKESSANGLAGARSSNKVNVIDVAEADKEIEGRNAANCYLTTPFILLLNTRIHPQVTVCVGRIDKISCFQIVQQNAHYRIYQVRDFKSCCLNEFFLSHKILISCCIQNIFR